MRKTLTVLGLTIAFLGLIDVAVSLTLNWADRAGRLGGLVQYFDYGRSVPGKLDQWVQDPQKPGNLFDIAWRPQAVARSKAEFDAEDATSGPVIRSYGMSFVNNIIRQALDLQPDLVWDGHAGPGAPPNFTFALFHEDRENRRAGDIAVLGILSSSVPAMAALSNSTWVFEQPAPFTYPVFWPDGDGLRRIDPIVNSAAAQTALTEDPAMRQAWYAQLAEHDAFYGPQTFGLSRADASPFARLVRRSMAKSHIERTEAALLAGDDYPYRLVLQRMISDFARTARADGQRPIVILIQSRDPTDANVLDIAKPVLQQEAIPYLATAEHFDPADPSGFLPDGHYTPDIDRLFAEELIENLGL